MNPLSSTVLYLEKFCKILIVVFFIVMVITTFSQVILRFIFSSSLSWSGEMARYCLIWLTFIGGALGVRAKVHVAVEAITTLLPENVKRGVARLNYLIITAFGAVLVIYGYQLSAYNIMRGQLSPALHLPIGLVYAAIPVGGLLILVFALEMFINPDLKGELSE